MVWNRKLRTFGVAVSILAIVSMVTTPTYAAAGNSGQRVKLHTTAAALQVVQQENAALYQRLLAYRSGQDVKVTAKERAYLDRVNYRVKQMAAAAQSRATEFSSQTRALSPEARQAYAAEDKKAAKPAQVVVTPDPWKFWKDMWEKGSPLLLLLFPVAAPFVIIINLIIQAFLEYWPKIKAAT